MRLNRLFLALAVLAAMISGSLGPRVVGVAHATGTAGAMVDPALRAALAGADVPVQVVVTFHGDGAPSASQVDLLKGVGVTTGLTFRSLPMAGVLATSSQVDALAANPEVRSLYLNAPLTYYNYEATAMTGVDRLRTDATMISRNGGMPVSGHGVGVVVNDSGVDGTHKDIELGRNLKQNALGSTNLNAYSGLLPITYVENLSNTDTNSGHGTHVAGTVGGTGAMSGGKYEGVAPGAALVGYGSGAALFVLDGIGGFDYAITHQREYGIRVITNSWGSSGDFNPEHPINVASYKAYKRNITVLFAAGNAGPGEDTHNPYAKAPWVISVAAGDKQGRLADFSSRGVRGKGGTFTYDGQSWTWEDRPSVTAPGVSIISTRVLAPVSSLAATEDASLIEPAYLPFYTTMDGTSMATPHAAGIVALMLEANPQLTPDGVKQILQETATNIPGRESWEAGAGYINAYAAVDRAYQDRNYGMTLNMARTFHSSAGVATTRSTFTVDYNPVTMVSDNRVPFTVPSGLTKLEARANADGFLGETGNLVNLILIAPDGTEYGSGVSLLFPLYRERTVSVSAPTPGNWTLELRGLRGDTANPTDGAALPEQVSGVLTFNRVGQFTGLNDIAGHPAEAAIKSGVSARLLDGYADGSFKPGSPLTRRELAIYLVMGAEVRQSLPLGVAASFTDIAAADLPFAEAVFARGAATRDQFQTARGVMLPVSASTFGPTQSVTRDALAYSLVQSLGLEAEAIAKNGAAVTVQYDSTRIAVEDAGEIGAELAGYVQLALDLNILNAYFYTTQGPYDLQPTVHATFKPAQVVTRGEFSVAMSRFYSAYLTR